ncbi:SPOR domain-containing protein [Flavobacterium sp.]|uniref:SPOR domain-containing protein n=1 Tax=Flavobacterium sp. TaxID=239 RepID=UPI0026266ABE|nr:SPOR domain-containing protein [Flavobacterium sp.]
MKIRLSKPLKKWLFLGLFFLNFNTLFSQQVTVEQDPKFEQLLAEKRKINAAITVNNRYKIQLFSGASEDAKKMLALFRKDNKQYDATIVFSTPMYKVWVGNFKSRIEAERNLILLKKKYPNALVVKPNRA